MELGHKEFTLVEDAFLALVAQLEQEIVEIKQLDDSCFAVGLRMNQFKKEPKTVEELKEIEIQKVKKKIAETKELHKKLSSPHNTLLVVSNKIQLQLTIK